MTNDDLFDRLAQKWHDYYRADAGEHDIGVVSAVLENQSRYFDTLPDEARAELVKVLGKDFEETILRAIGKELLDADMLKLFSAQAFCQPISTISWVKTLGDESISAIDALSALTASDRHQIPELQFKLETEAVSADNRDLRTRIPDSADLVALFGDHLSQQTTEIVFKTAFEEILHQTLAQCIEAAPDPVVHIARPGNQLFDSIRQAQVSVHRLSHRGPANWLIGHSDHARELHSFKQAELANALHFEIFPKDTILLFRNGPSFLDGPVVWAPYHFQLKPQSTEEAIEEAKKAGTLYKEFNIHRAVKLTLRHHVKVVNPSHIALVKIEEWSNEGSGQTGQ